MVMRGSDVDVASVDRVFDMAADGIDIRAVDLAEACAGGGRMMFERLEGWLLSSAGYRAVVVSGKCVYKKTGGVRK